MKTEEGYEMKNKQFIILYMIFLLGMFSKVFAQTINYQFKWESNRTRNGEQTKEVLLLPCQRNKLK